MREHGKIEAENSQKESLLDCFRTIDFSIKKELDNLLYHALSEYSDLLESFSYLKRILDDVTLELFRRHPWLELYFQADDFILPETAFPDCEEQIQKSVDDFIPFLQSLRNCILHTVREWTRFCCIS